MKNACTFVDDGGGASGGVGPPGPPGPPGPAGSPAGNLFWGNEDVGANLVDRYLSPGHEDGAAMTADRTGVPITRAGTLRNFVVRHNAANNGTVVTYSVLVNGVATGIVVALASAAPITGSDLVNTFAVVVGDRVSIKVTKPAVMAANGRVDVQANLEY